MASYYSALVEFASAHSHYAHGMIFVLALSEAVPVVGTFVPGSTLILVISALAANANANPWLLLAAACLGAIAGDGLSFWVGQQYSREILGAWPINRYPHFIAHSENSSPAMERQASFSRASRPPCAPLCRWFPASCKCRRASFTPPISCRR